MVKRWFGEITQKRIRRGVFKSLSDVVKAIEDYINSNNQNPKPFVWTKKAEDILEKMVKLLDPDDPPNQVQFQTLVKANLDIGKNSFRKLLIQGTDRFWYVERSKTGNKLVYFRTKNK